MKFFLTILWITIAIFSANCGKADSAKMEPVAPQGDSQVGPFTIQLDATGTYEHSFSANIDQDEGKVEYFFVPSESGKIELTAASLNFSECDVKNITYQIFWLPDAQTTMGLLVVVGQSVTVETGKKGLFLFSVKGITGCKTITSYLKLKRKPTTVPPEPPPVNLTPATSWSNAKSVLCSKPNGDQFFTNFSEIMLGQDQYGLPKITFGSVCHGSKVSSNSFGSKVVVGPGNQVNYQMGPYTVLQVYSSDWKVIGFFSSANGKVGTGALGVSYNTAGSGEQGDMTCQFYKSSFASCP